MRTARDPETIKRQIDAQTDAAISQLLRDGDIVRLCAEQGQLEALVDAPIWDARTLGDAPPAAHGTGRELFALMRDRANEAERGAKDGSFHGGNFITPLT